MRKIVLVLVLTITMLLSGCNDASGDDEWWIFDFPHDSFPDTISFNTKYQVYTADTEIITAALYSTGYRQALYYINFFRLVKQVDNQWHTYAFGGSTVVNYYDIIRGWIYPSGEKTTVTIVSGDSPHSLVPFDLFNRRAYTNEPLTAGTYRIIKYVELLEERFVSASVSRGFCRYVIIWHGLVWAEFEIVG